MSAPAASSSVPGVRAVVELGRSALRFSWAGAAFGADQLTRLTRPGAGAAAAFDAVTLAARRGMDPLPQAFFQAADDFQKEWLDRVPGDLSPPSWRRFTRSLATAAGTYLTVLRPDVEGTVTRRELFHKLEVYALVRRGSASLGPRAETRASFHAAVEKALELEPRHALWVLEGLGHGHARAALARDPEPSGLLIGARLPQRALMMVHLGLGMALAEHVFGALDPEDENGIRRAIDRFTGLCLANSEPGHEDAALESLGLVLRCFLPELVAPVDRGLPETAGERPLREYFWHGVGRAIYFLPLHLIPGHGSIEVALGRLEGEAPDRRASANGRAGVAYAAALVNLGTPVVLERFARRCPEALDRAFVGGLASALMLRRRTTPDTGEVETFLGYRPEGGDPEAKERWLRRVIEPVEMALLQGNGAGGAVVRKLAGASHSEGRATS